MAVAKATTAMMLVTDRRPARNTSGAAPVDSPIASSTIGFISGAINIAPMTTAVLSSARPSVASAAAIISWSQYPTPSPARGRSIAWSTSARPAGSSPR
ncbi:MAG: hypothetical protein WKG01_01830 [Kofleriaceae bacterium]